MCRLTFHVVVVAIFALAPVTSCLGAKWVPLTENKPNLGDLTAMQENGRIRVLVSFSKTDFFLLRGEPRGFEAELMIRFEKHLNKEVERESDRTRVVFVPVAFERLIPALLAGEGDLIAAGLTLTEERSKLVAFSDPYLPLIDEIVVSRVNAGDDTLSSIEDLSARSVYVLRASSYEQHLRELSRTFEARGLEPIEIIGADENLSDSDILELVNAGVVEHTVIDSHLADLWSGVLTKLHVHNDLKINEGGQIAWAVRQSNPQLLSKLNEFVVKSRKGTHLGNILFRRYFENEKLIKNPLEEQISRRLNKYAPLFRTYAKRYNLDWMAVAAQAYQESGFDHSLISEQGAVGMMQLLPSTAADPIVGIADISSVENNVHAAVRYLAFLRREFFADASIPEPDRLGFMWAAYNAGPDRVRRMRERAQKIGLDPNRWFFNVEHAAQSVAGPETVRHVANTYKYYVAYRLSEALLRRKSVQIESLSSSQEQSVE